jgi:hypothetical protein
MPLYDQIALLFAKDEKTKKLLAKLEARIERLEQDLKAKEFRYRCSYGCNIAYNSEYALKGHLKAKHKIIYMLKDDGSMLDIVKKAIK